MSTPEVEVTSDAGSRFVELAGRLADFSNPFYAEERQRDVWNEASTFGLQVLVWLGLTASTVVVWTVGAAALPYVVSFALLVGAVGWLTAAYAAALSVDALDPRWLSRPHLGAFAVVYVAFFAGCAHAAVRGDRLSFLLGSAVGVAVVGAGATRHWRRARARDLTP